MRKKQPRSASRNVIRDLLRSVGDMSRVELCSETGFSARSVQEYIAELRAMGLVYIKRWHVKGQERTPYYALRTNANQVDAVIVPMTRAEIHKRYRQKYKAKLNLKDRLRRNPDNPALPGPNNPFAALVLHATAE